MASEREGLRDTCAAAELARAKAADGVQISYSHQGVGPVTLWARVSDADVGTAGGEGCLLEGESRRFRIPRQTGFSGAVSENDEIAWEGRTYVVVRDWRTERHDAIYVVTAIHGQVRRAEL